LDLDNFAPKPSDKSLATKLLKRMLIVPWQVAQKALGQETNCHESWKNFNWFELKTQFDGLPKLDLAKFRPWCRRLFQIDERHSKAIAGPLPGDARLGCSTIC
jgi:hypothetical protein